MWRTQRIPSKPTGALHSTVLTCHWGLDAWLSVRSCRSGTRMLVRAYEMEIDLVAVAGGRSMAVRASCLCQLPAGRRSLSPTDGCVRPLTPAQVSPPFPHGMPCALACTRCSEPRPGCRCPGATAGRPGRCWPRRLPSPGSRKSATERKQEEQQGFLVGAGGLAESCLHMLVPEMLPCKCPNANLIWAD